LVGVQRKDEVGGRGRKRLEGRETVKKRITNSCISISISPSPPPHGPSPLFAPILRLLLAFTYIL